MQVQPLLHVSLILAGIAVRPQVAWHCSEVTSGMQGNLVVSTYGLELLPCLAVLDLGYNLITSLEEVFRLGGTRPNLCQPPCPCA